MVRVRIRVKVRVSVMVRVSSRTSWVVNFALFRCYRPVIYTRPVSFGHDRDVVSVSTSRNRADHYIFILWFLSSSIFSIFHA